MEIINSLNAFIAVLKNAKAIEGTGE